MEELRDKNARLEEVAVRDGLTGLYNHAYFQDQVESELKRSSRHGHEFGLVFIDVDRFKQVNDSLGHPVGDVVLKRIAALLQGKAEGDFRLRDHDVAARYGGDEFVLIMPETPKAATATKAEQLRAAFTEQAFDGVPDHLRPSLSIGVAAYPTDAETRESLIEAADAALYAAKRMGRNRVMSYEPPAAGEVDAREANARTRDHALALEESIAARAFRFVYQPIVDGHRNAIIGYEALSRGPEGGEFERPDKLFKIAYDADLVLKLERLCRKKALEAAAHMPKDRNLFLNIEPDAVNEPQLRDITLATLMTDGALTPENIVLEITERTAIIDFTAFRQTLEYLRALGFSVAVDDAGAGYGSLQCLAEVRPEWVKIDISLVRSCDTDKVRRQLIGSLVAFADGIGVKLVAEGIETKGELYTLRELGIEYGQGFLFTQPVPPFPDESDYDIEGLLE